MNEPLADYYSTDDLPEGARLSTDLLPEAIIALMLDPAYQLYTQMDAEDDETIYSKEFHYVNRTGVFAWVRKPE